MSISEKKVSEATSTTRNVSSGTIVAHKGYKMKTHKVVLGIVDLNFVEI